MSWLTLVIVIGAFVVQIASRAWQEIDEKRKLQKSKQDREGRVRDVETTVLRAGDRSREVPELGAKADPRRSIAERRQAELRAWREQHATNRVSAVNQPTGDVEARVGMSQSGGGLVQQAVVDLQRATKMQEQLRQQTAAAQARSSSSSSVSSRASSTKGKTRSSSLPSSRPTSKVTSSHSGHSLSDRDVEENLNLPIGSLKKQRQKAMASSMEGRKASAANRLAELREYAEDPANLRRAFVLKELFDAPVALRDDESANHMSFLPM